MQRLGGWGSGVFRLPDGEVHHVVDLVPPDETPEGEALQLDDEHVGQSPQQQLLGRLAMLLALWAVPGHTHTHRHRYIGDSFLIG